MIQHHLLNAQELRDQSMPEISVVTNALAYYGRCKSSIVDDSVFDTKLPDVTTLHSTLGKFWNEDIWDFGSTMTKLFLLYFYKKTLLSRIN